MISFLVAVDARLATNASSLMIETMEIHQDLPVQRGVHLHQNRQHPNPQTHPAKFVIFIGTMEAALEVSIALTVTSVNPPEHLLFNPHRLETMIHPPISSQRRAWQ